MSFTWAGRQAGRPARPPSGPQGVKRSLAKSLYVPTPKDLLLTKKREKEQEPLA